MPDITAHDVLVRADQILSDEGKWCRGAVALDWRGNRCSEMSRDAVRWCLTGAVWRALQEAAEGREYGYDEALKTVAFGALDAICKHPYGITRFNDDSENTFADVRDVLAKAIEATREG